MKIVGPAFLDRFGGRVINTHPALLPAFPGAHAVRDAVAYGVQGHRLHRAPGRRGRRHRADPGPAGRCRCEPGDDEADAARANQSRGTATARRHGRQARPRGLHRERTKGEHPVTATQSGLDTSARRSRQRALISVSDKTGLVELATALHDGRGERSCPPATRATRARRRRHPGHRGRGADRLPGEPRTAGSRRCTRACTPACSPTSATRSTSPAGRARDRAVRTAGLQPLPVHRRPSPPARAPTSASSRSTSAARRWSAPPRRTTPTWPSWSTRPATTG